jgi:hypothetical protein
MYLVYQVPLSGVGVVEHLVSYDTLHLLEHILQEEEGMREWDIGRRASQMGRGNSIRLARYDQSTIHLTSRPSRALGH